MKDGKQMGPKPGSDQIVLDGREKLEADVQKHFTHRTSTAMWPPSANKTTDWILVSMETILGWLDRLRMEPPVEAAFDAGAGKDSREKLEAEVVGHVTDIRHKTGWTGVCANLSTVIGWLDRQAAITEREWKEQCAADECCGFQELVDINTQVQAKVDELTEERDRLRGQLDEFDGDCYCGATVTEWYELAARLQDEVDVLKAEIGLHVDEHKKLRSQVELKDDIIEGLRQSLDEIMAERNALVHCLEADHDLKASWDGLRKAWNIEVTDEYIDAWDALSHAFDRACAYIADKMGTCPKDAEDYDRDCGSICHDQLAECWRHYFEHTQHDTVESLLDEFMVALHELGEGADYGPTKERMAERIRKAVER